MTNDILLASPHTHIESYLTASTLQNFIETSKKIGRQYLSYTDNGHLYSAMKAYKMSTENGLKFIPGIEFYFKDSQCPFVTNTEADRCKYFTATIHCLDQKAYEALCKIVNKSNFPIIEIYEEKQQLWSWDDLKEISKHNVTLTLGGIHCMVGKTMLAGKPDISRKIFEYLKAIFGDKLYTSIIVDSWSKKWSSVVEILYKDGTKDSVLANHMISTDRARKIKAIDLIEKKHHSFIKSIYRGTNYTDINKEILSTKLHKGFLPLPGGDALLKVNKFLYILAKEYGVKTLVSDYAYYASKEDKLVQTMRLEGTNKLQSNFYLKSAQDIHFYLTQHFKFDENQIGDLIENTNNWAKLFDDFKFKYEWRLADAGDNPMKTAMDIIKQNGRMKWNDPVYVNRLKEEISVICKNPKKDLMPYFLPIVDLIKFCKDNGILTGVARGSSGGSLLCYLLGITNLDPIKWDLPFSRFFSLDRIMSNKLPDIDSDFSSREILVGDDGKSGYLYEKYGDKIAQISTRNKIRLKSAIKDTNRYIKGEVEPEIERLTKALPNPSQGVSDQDSIFGHTTDDGEYMPGLIHTSTDLKYYINNRPKEWEIVEKSLGITRAFGAHAAAFVISDESLKNIIPLKDGHITQYEMKEIEQVGLVKYDFLVVKQLKDIEVCLNLINKKNNETNTIGYFTHDNEKRYIWDLPQVKEVFQSVWSGNTETLFQINTRSMIPYVKDILPQTINDLSTIVALVRPGPLDFIDESTGRSMAQEYVARRKGESEWSEDALSKYLPETFGVLIYQEQVNKIARELAGFSGEEAEKLRENIGKKKITELQNMKSMFIDNASKKIDKNVAEKIWERIVTFGRYGFNKSHSFSYSLITYATMFLRHFYPLEWWSAILTNATEKEITTEFWAYVKDMVLPPDINLSSDTMVVDYERNKLRAKLGIIKGMGDKTINPIIENRPYKDIQDFVDKGVCGDGTAHKLIHVGVLDSLFPPNMNLIEKIKTYQDAVQIKVFREKVEQAKKEKRKLRLVSPKAGVVPDIYVDLEKNPMKDAAMKKAILPTFPISTFDLGRQYSKVMVTSQDGKAMVEHGRKRNPLINGNMFKRLDEMPEENVTENLYVAATGFILKYEKFNYAKNTKQALKLIIDVDGYISEKVMWPDYETQVLNCPKELDEGKIATFFFKKRKLKKDVSITDIVIES